MGKLFKVWCNATNEWERHKIFVEADGTLWHEAPYGPIRLRPYNHTIVWITGIKDRDGTYIYDGDIVLCGPSVIGMCLQVVFECGMFLQCGKGMQPDIWYDWDEVRVVGNIYENKDLLEDVI
jgi:hypothetical protein